MKQELTYPETQENLANITWRRRILAQNQSTWRCEQIKQAFRPLAEINKDLFKYEKK